MRSSVNECFFCVIDIKRTSEACQAADFVVKEEKRLPKKKITNGG